MTSEVNGNGWIATLMVLVFIVGIGFANLLINAVAWALGR